MKVLCDVHIARKVVRFFEKQGATFAAPAAGALQNMLPL